MSAARSMSESSVTRSRIPTTVKHWPPIWTSVGPRHGRSPAARAATDPSTTVGYRSVAAVRKRPRGELGAERGGRSRSVASTVIPPVDLRVDVLVAAHRRTGDAVQARAVSARRRARRSSSSRLRGARGVAEERLPGCTVRRLVPSGRSYASRSAWLDAEMPSTATIDAIPIATPSAESAARRRRVRRPMLPTASTSRPSSRLGGSASVTARLSSGSSCAGRRTISPSRISTRRWQRGGELGVVRDHHERRAVAVELAQELEDLGARAAVEVAGRLVGEDDRRVAGDRASDRHALALSAGELVRPVVRARAEPDALERGRARARRSVGGMPGVEQAVRRRCRGRHARRAGRTAGRRSRSAGPAAPRGRRRSTVEVVPGDPHAPGGRPVERAHDLQQRRLPRAGRPDDPHELDLAGCRGRCRAAPGRRRRSAS